MNAVYLGTARARLGPAAALIDSGRNLVAACEENRLTRAVDSGTAGPPELSISELLRYLGRERSDIGTMAGVAEEGDLDPHLAHAEYARVSAGWNDAVAVVVGTDTSAWFGRERIPLPEPPPITAAYGELTARLRLRPTRDEHLVEALARGGHPEAAPVQHELGQQLLDMLSVLKDETAATRLCLSGGLFFNTYFTTRVAASRIFDEIYVPPHPGRNGAALGAALVVARRAGAAGPFAGVESPYLGPSYSNQEIKATLENCKLSFDLMHDDQLFEAVLHQLSRGRLVGWYDGRLEWGPRALGHRSVLADPFAPHVLENLNGFLKRRPAFRPYGVSVPASRLVDLFETSFPGAPADDRAPGASPFMQYEYRPKSLDAFRTILPPGVQTLRVHTVDESEPRFLRLLQVWGDRTGLPVLVNTSFNGFHEPLVCTPRDAIRVFYGTGLDVLALGNFLLAK